MMNPEKVQLLAEQAGDSWDDTLVSDKEFLARFADLVATNEREECAKMCEQAGVDGYGTLAAAAMIRSTEVNR